jgi:hypothetical protein
LIPHRQLGPEVWCWLQLALEQQTPHRQLGPEVDRMRTLPPPLNKFGTNAHLHGS